MLEKQVEAGSRSDLFREESIEVRARAAVQVLKRHVQGISQQSDCLR